MFLRSLESKDQAIMHFCPLLVLISVVHSHLSHCFLRSVYLRVCFVCRRGSGRIITSISRVWSICKHVMNLSSNFCTPFYNVKWFVWSCIRSITRFWQLRILRLKRIGTVVSFTPLRAKCQTSKWRKSLDTVVLQVWTIPLKFISNVA